MRHPASLARSAALALLVGLGPVVPPAPLSAQEAGSEAEDRGRVIAFLEEQLSGAGREVRIEGFRGALSSRMEMASLTIADAEGVWLSIRGATLDWNRLQVLRGRIEISALMADEIEIIRAPLPEPGPPAPEAGGFSLPELPVSVRIGRLEAGRLALGAPLLGEPVTVQVSGAVSLVDGAADALLEMERSDGRTGAARLAVQAGGGRLDLELALREGPGGLVAAALGIIGEPALDLELAGAGPAEDFAAAFTLATDGIARLTGAARTEAAAAGGFRFEGAVSGDVTALFAPEYRPFFGPDIALEARGARDAEGGVVLDALSLRAAALMLAGEGMLAPDGFPERLALRGTLLPPGGETVRLPLPGPATETTGGTLSLAFDAATGPDWTGETRLRALSRDGLQIEEISVVGTGRIARERGDDLETAPTIRRVLGDLVLEAAGIAHEDDTIASALGTQARAELSIDWAEAVGLRLDRLTLAGAGYALRGRARVGTLGEGFPVAARLSGEITELAAFSGLAGQALSGELQFNTRGTGTLLGGEIDAAFGARTRDLGVGIAEIDGLLAGEGRAALGLTRDAEGLVLHEISVETGALLVRAEGRVAGEDGALSATARLPDLSALRAGLSGAVEAGAEMRLAGEQAELSISLDGPDGARIAFAGIARDVFGRPALDGELRLSLPSLSPLAPLAGGRLAGATEGRVRLSAETGSGALEIEAAGSLRDLQAGPEIVSTLMRGESTIGLRVSRTAAESPFEIVQLRLANPQGGLEAAGRAGAGETRLRLSARLADAALLTPDLTGTLSAEGTVEEREGLLWLDFDGSGPGGSTGRLSGSVAPDSGRADLAARGTVPLALTDPFLGPVRARGSARYDLALRGAPGLPALSGEIVLQEARLFAPLARIALSPVEARVTLSGGAARIAASAGVEGGGRLTAGGQIDLLRAGLPGALEIALDSVLLRDAALYDTSLSGSVAVNGPLAGGARIGGDLRLGATEIRVPSGGLAGGGAILPIAHLNEPAAVRSTRARAGLLDTGAGSGGGGPVYPLDLSISAPQRIFVRGRGLDAELGGAIRLRGTSADPAPEGRFELVRGRLDLLGRRLDLVEGWAQLLGGFDPQLFLAARSEAPDGTRVTITLSGRASSLDLGLSSEPQLPEDEILARLFFGRGIDRISPLQAAQLASALADLAGGGTGGGVVGRLRRGFGLDDLDVTTEEGGGATLRAGRYLTENVYTNVTVGSDGQSTVTINLDLPRGLTARGSIDGGGRSGVGLFLERDY